MTGLGALVTESNEVLREWSEGKSQLDTLEKDFFFLRGGRTPALNTRGKGGGSIGREMSVLEGEAVIVVEKVADASLKDLWRIGIWTVLEGAVLGRVSS